MSIKISTSFNTGSISISSYFSNSTAIVTLCINIIYIYKYYKYLTSKDKRYDIRFIKNQTGFDIYILLYT